MLRGDGAREATAARELVPAALAALAAAVVGGVVWGLIVKATDYELGFVAWGIGWLCGTAVVFAARGRKGAPLQIVAIIGALVGILLGKYLSFAFSLQEALEEGPLLDIGVLSADMVEAFRDDLGAVFSLFDVLWVGFAVFTAWRLPRPDEPAPEEPPAEAPPPPENG